MAHKQDTVLWETKEAPDEKNAKVVSINRKRNEVTTSFEPVRTEVEIKTESEKTATVIYVTSGFGEIKAGSGSGPRCMAA
ncbi:hypothetical protein WD019_07545 [Fictibacillus sp. Mic-4]|uniref:hypothetical protein n=1 Tax=Fictibacillus TaxID=1329200 RepID=UPI000411D4A5|nr:hypothetical protein [Fictibacillus gelatini]